MCSGVGGCDKIVLFSCGFPTIHVHVYGLRTFSPPPRCNSHPSRSRKTRLMRRSIAFPWPLAGGRRDVTTQSIPPTFRLLALVSVIVVVIDLRRPGDRMVKLTAWAQNVTATTTTRTSTTITATVPTLTLTGTSSPPTSSSLGSAPPMAAMLQVLTLPDGSTTTNFAVSADGVVVTPAFLTVEAMQDTSSVSGPPGRRIIVIFPNTPAFALDTSQARWPTFVSLRGGDDAENRPFPAGMDAFMSSTICPDHSCVGRNASNVITISLNAAPQFDLYQPQTLFISFGTELLVRQATDIGVTVSILPLTDAPSVGAYFASVMLSVVTIANQFALPGTLDMAGLSMVTAAHCSTQHEKFLLPLSEYAFVPSPRVAWPVRFVILEGSLYLAMVLFVAFIQTQRWLAERARLARERRHVLRERRRLEAERIGVDFVETVEDLEDAELEKEEELEKQAKEKASAAVAEGAQDDCDEEEDLNASAMRGVAEGNIIATGAAEAKDTKKEKQQARHHEKLKLQRLRRAAPLVAGQLFWFLFPGLCFTSGVLVSSVSPLLQVVGVAIGLQQVVSVVLFLRWFYRSRSWTYTTFEEGTLATEAAGDETVPPPAESNNRSVAVTCRQILVLVHKVLLPRGAWANARYGWRIQRLLPRESHGADSQGLSNGLLLMWLYTGGMYTVVGMMVRDDSQCFYQQVSLAVMWLASIGIVLKFQLYRSRALTAASCLMRLLCALTHVAVAKSSGSSSEPVVYAGVGLAIVLGSLRLAYVHFYLRVKSLRLLRRQRQRDSARFLREMRAAQGDEALAGLAEDGWDVLQRRSPVEGETSPQLASGSSGLQRPLVIVTVEDAIATDSFSGRRGGASFATSSIARDDDDAHDDSTQSPAAGSALERGLRMLNASALPHLLRSDAASDSASSVGSSGSRGCRYDFGDEPAYLRNASRVKPRGTGVPLAGGLSWLPRERPYVRTTNEPDSELPEVTFTRRKMAVRPRRFEDL